MRFVRGRLSSVMVDGLAAFIGVIGWFSLDISYVPIWLRNVTLWVVF